MNHQRIPLYVSLIIGFAGVASPVALAQNSGGSQTIAGYADRVSYSLSNVRISAAVDRELTRQGVTPHTYTAGWGWNRTDFYAVSVTLPSGVNPRDILDQVRDDPTSLAGGRLDNEVGWPAAPTSGRSQYDVIDLDIWGADNGAIAYIDVDTSDNDFTIMTVTNEASGTHPVSGVRRWGFTPLTNGRWLFWTAGIESANVAGPGDIGASLQEGTWTGLMRDIGDEVIGLGGQAHNVYSDDQWQPGDLIPGSNARSDLDSTGEIDKIEKHSTPVTTPPNATPSNFLPM